MVQRNSVTGPAVRCSATRTRRVGTASTTGVPLLYVGTDGQLRGQFATGHGRPRSPRPATVNDGKWHHVVLSVDGRHADDVPGRRQGRRGSPGRRSTTPAHLQPDRRRLCQHRPASWPAWGTTAQRYFDGTIDEVAVYAHPLGAAAGRRALPGRARRQADQLRRSPCRAARSAAEADLRHQRRPGQGVHRRQRRHLEDRRADGLRRRHRPAPQRRGAGPGRPAAPVRVRRARPAGCCVPARRWARDPGRTSRASRPCPRRRPTEVCTQPDPNDPAFCTTIPGNAGGPVFVRHGAGRHGHPLVLLRRQRPAEQGHQRERRLGRDDLRRPRQRHRRARPAARTTDATRYTTYPGHARRTRSTRATTCRSSTRDGRSANATDTDLPDRATPTHPPASWRPQTEPDGSSTRHTYTNGAEAAVGGGNITAGLLATTTDGRGKVTRLRLLPERRPGAGHRRRPVWSPSTPTTPSAARSRRRRSPTASRPA